MNKKGFTVIELIAVIFVLTIAFILTIPIVIKIIDYSKYKAFVAGAQNVIDAFDLYIAKNKFVNIPEEGIFIEDLDNGDIKNNNYDSGVILRRKEETVLVNLSKDNFCAKGTKMDLITTDKGCGALDETGPEKVDIFVKNETDTYLYLVIGGYDSESKIIKYELSIDNNKYYKNEDEKYNVFRIAKDGKKHSFKAKITNEAGLTLESESKTFESESETIICTNNKIGYKKNLNCSLEIKTFTKIDNIDLEEENNIYSILLEENKNIILENDDINIDIDVVGIDSLLKDNTPILEENMVPIVYENNKWIIADRNIKYWDYENKIWANAVITKKNQDINDPNSKSRKYYLSKNAIGEEINENDIIGYYVWIPKFSYTIWNSAGIDVKKENKGVRNIDIDFSSDSNIHNAFLYNTESTGFWVSKYEASVNSDTSCAMNSGVENCNNKNLEIYFKNSEFILKNISISNAYDTINKLNKKIDVTNTHLLTNLEWGAITYLSHSKYGIGNNIISETTTGNVTGIYNMGINKEFVMGNYNSDLGFDDKNNSGFDKIPNSYIDIYKSSTIKGRILGDATGETEKWYESDNNFINGNYPFITRGGNSIFDFNNSSGSADSNTTFRMVISK